MNDDNTQIYEYQHILLNLNDYEKKVTEIQ